MSAAKGSIELVRGQIGDELAGHVTALWSEVGGLSEQEARERLGDVVCVLTDPDGSIGGLSFVTARGVAGVGDRHFWVYGDVLRPGHADAADDLFNASFDALASGFDPDGNDPLGLCMEVGDPAVIEKRPEAVWPATQLLLAGYRADGAQVRIRYFEDAAIAPGDSNSPKLSETRSNPYPLPDRYRLVPFTPDGEVGPDDVLALWKREGAVPEAEARRRVHEVHLVAVDRDEGVVGVSSAYLQRSAQLRMDLLYFRAFVASAHRKSNLAAQLALSGRKELDSRFVAGEERRAAGIVYEVENPGLKSFFNRALWLPLDFTFIGVSDRDAHVRVHYFPGAKVPPVGGAA